MIGPPDPSAPARPETKAPRWPPAGPGRARGVSRASALGTVLRETDDLGVLRETEQAPLTQLNSGVREALGLREGDETSDVRGAVANDGSVLVYRVDADGLLVNFAILQSEADRQSVRNQVGAFRIEERAASRGGRRRGGRRRGGSRRLAGLRTRQEQEAAAAAQSAAEAAAVRARVERPAAELRCWSMNCSRLCPRVRGASDVPGLTARPAGHQSIRRQTPLSDRAAGSALRAPSSAATWAPAPTSSPTSTSRPPPTASVPPAPSPASGTNCAPWSTVPATRTSPTPTRWCTTSPAAPRGSPRTSSGAPAGWTPPTTPACASS